MRFLILFIILLGTAAGYYVYKDSFNILNGTRAEKKVKVETVKSTLVPLSTGMYEKLAIGMNYHEAESILGEPSTCNNREPVKRCLWGDHERFIKVDFTGDKIVHFEAAKLGSEGKNSIDSFLPLFKK